MQISIKGELTIAEIRQAIFEQLHELEDDYAIKFARGTTIYVTPTDGEGKEVVARSHDGNVIWKLISSGPYRSAADIIEP